MSRKLASRFAFAGHISETQDACRVAAVACFAHLFVDMRALRRRLGADADHAAYLADFMNCHRAKRNLMKLLQASG